MGEPKQLGSSRMMTIFFFPRKALNVNFPASKATYPGQLDETFCFSTENTELMSRNGKSFSYLPTTAYLLKERKLQNVYIINTLPCSVDLALQGL